MSLKNQSIMAQSAFKKKSYTILLVLLFCPGILFSQNDEEKTERKIHFGPKIGASYSNAFDHGEGNFNTNGKFGFVGGGFVQFPVLSFLSIQPEVLFSQKGFYGNGSMMNVDYEFKRTTNFLDIPVFIVWSPSPYVKILAGPQFSYLLKQTDVVTYPVNSNNIEDALIDDEVRKSVGGFAGGFDFYLQEFVVGIRAGVDFQENRKGNNVNTPQYKNNWIQLTVGVIF